jgi:hypothetical protein
MLDSMGPFVYLRCSYSAAADIDPDHSALCPLPGTPWVWEREWVRVSPREHPPHLVLSRVGERVGCGEGTRGYPVRVAGICDNWR